MHFISKAIKNFEGTFEKNLRFTDYQIYILQRKIINGLMLTKLPIKKLDT